MTVITGTNFTQLNMPWNPFAYVECFSFVNYHSNYSFVEAPQINKPSVQPSYNEASPVNISCTASGTPDPDVRWIRNKIVIGSGKKSAFLVFNSINRTDNGQYTCEANNSAGNDQDNMKLVVHCK